MPRTRAATSSSSNTPPVLSQECQYFIEEFKRHALQKQQQNKKNGEMTIGALISQIDIAMSRQSPAIMAMTLGELWNSELQGHEVTSTVSNSNSIKIPSKMRCRTVVSPRITRSRTRDLLGISYSNSMSGLVESSMQKKTSILKVGSSMKYQFKTPYSKTSASEYAAVTPKIQPNTPICVLRKPKRGEMVLSMQGSPLLVSGNVQERVANINVPTSNGNLISLLPNRDLRMSILPPLDQGTISQLKTLNGHIKKIIKSQ